MDVKGLVRITDKLTELGIPYALGGSGLLHALGLVEQMNDWDLLVECPKEKLTEAIQGYSWQEQTSGEGLFASEYRIQVVPLSIDFIGYFAMRSMKGIVKLPLGKREGSSWQGIPLSAPETWYVAYKMMGREPKAELLYNYLKNKDRNEEIITELARNEMMDESIKADLLRLLG
ncbi:hypothetical protein [Paenibacillus sp. P36]|uniref:hypothetical protein n=1 Tax=Paenibacillus sp. P36 TaxID=3342538 RepID=UPI0038B3CCC9